MSGRHVWRRELAPDDPALIRELVAATELFSDEEQDMAEELAQERLSNGPRSGYEFAMVLNAEALRGFACFGRIPGSETSWDLYWIAVHPGQQRTGIGATLLRRVELDVSELGGRFLYADTSSSPAYAGTREFYVAQGFRLAAEFPDFYRLGDGKSVYVKALPRPCGQSDARTAGRSSPAAGITAAD